MKKQVLSVIAASALALTASAQLYIPNDGMETWGTQFGEDQQPTNWVSYNVFTISFIDPGNVNPTSVTQATGADAYQGTYAAKITTVDLGDNPDAATIPNRAGILMVGAVSISSPYLRPGYQFTARPQTFEYYAKYTPSGVDTGFCLVALTKWNGTSRDTVAWGYSAHAAATSAYSLYTIGLIYNASQTNTFPDTAAIIFSSSSSAPQAGSSLWVDALAFSGNVGVEEAQQNNGVSVYPNPSSSVTYFDVVSGEASTVAVYDMTGREVSRTRIYGKKGAVDTNTLAEGMYTYSILSTDGEPMSRGTFSVAR